MDDREGLIYFQLMSQKKGRETVGKRQYSKRSWLKIFQN